METTRSLINLINYQTVRRSLLSWYTGKPRVKISSACSVDFTWFTSFFAHRIFLCKALMVYLKQRLNTSTTVSKRRWRLTLPVVSSWASRAMIQIKKAFSQLVLAVFRLGTSLLSSALLTRLFNTRFTRTASACSRFQVLWFVVLWSMSCF